MEKKEYKNENLGEFDGISAEQLAISTKDLTEKVEQLEEHKVGGDNEGVVIEGNIDGEGKPIQDQRIRVRDDGAKIYRESRGDDFKPRNVKGCYKAFRKVREKENHDELLFNHYHYTTKEIEVMHAEIERLQSTLAKTVSEEVNSVFLDVKQVMEDYNIPEVERSIENSEN